MDIKDFILIGGGLLIAAVVAHGFWIAWRARRDPLKLDIVAEIGDDDVDDLRNLRGELPNGGGRVVRSEPPRQEALELEPSPGPADDMEELTGSEPPAAEPARLRTEPTVPDAADAADAADAQPPAAAPPESAAVTEIRTEPRESARPGREAPMRSARQTKESRRTAARARPPAPEPAPRADAPSEVFVITVLARDGRFNGDELMGVFVRNGLKFGDMNIFHRMDAASRSASFSVANAVEPGTFDLSAMDDMSTPGISFFMQLPGPDAPNEAFEDMLAVARDVAETLDGDLKDENLSVMTAQTVEHYRQRIVDFSRRRMSVRA